MGAKLVGLVLENWSKIDHNCFRVLVCMALHALDTPAPNREPSLYFGGWEELAGALSQTGTPETLRRNVLKYLSALAKLGAIEVAERGRPGKRATYRLLVTRKRPPET